MSNGVRLIPILIGLAIIAGMAAKGCHVGPFGRAQVISMSPGQELQLGRQAYQQVLTKDRGNVLPAADPVVEKVRSVGNRLRLAADDPEMRRKLGVSPDLKLEWEFNVIQSKQINAFCLPGGKVVVYTGILPICETEAGLAVVMGHEIGHALARHGAERMAQEQMATIGQVAVASSLGGLDPNKQRMVMGLLGAGTNVGVLLPFSRSHESEADHIGIDLMAAAGYDPREAPRFWVRMVKATGSGGSEFLSTHPSHERRIADLEKWVEEALPLFESQPPAPNRPLLRPGAFSPGDAPASSRKPKNAPTKGPGWEVK